MISLKKSPLVILQSFNSVSQCTHQILDGLLDQLWLRLCELETNGSQLIDIVTSSLEELHGILLARPNDRKSLAVLAAAIGQLYAVRFALATLVSVTAPSGSCRRSRSFSNPTGAFDRSLAYMDHSPAQDRLLAEEWLWQSVFFDPFGGCGIDGLRKLYIQTSIVQQPNTPLFSGARIPTIQDRLESVNRMINALGLKNLITGEINFVDLGDFEKASLNIKGGRHLLSLNAALVSELSRISLFTGLVKSDAQCESPGGLWPLVFLWILLRQFDGVGVHGTSLESLTFFLATVTKVLDNRDSTHAFTTRYRPPAPTTPPDESAAVKLAIQFNQSSSTCSTGAHTDSCSHTCQLAKSVVDFIYMMMANVDTDKVGQKIQNCQTALSQLCGPSASPRSSTNSSRIGSSSSPTNYGSQDADAQEHNPPPDQGSTEAKAEQSTIVWNEADDLLYYSILPALLCACMAALPRTELKKKFAIGICMRRILRVLVHLSDPRDPLKFFFAMNGIYYLIQRDGVLQDLASSGIDSAKAKKGGKRRQKALINNTTSLDSLTLEHRQLESRLLAEAVVHKRKMFGEERQTLPAPIAAISLPEDRWYHTHTACDLLDFPTCQGIIQSDWQFDLVENEFKKLTVVSKSSAGPLKRGMSNEVCLSPVMTLDEFKRSAQQAEGVEFLISELPQALGLCRLKLNNQTGDADERLYERTRRARLLVTLLSCALQDTPALRMDSRLHSNGANAEPMTVVVDVANVAISYGKQKYKANIFDSNGVIMAVNEIRRSGHVALCVVPEEYLNAATTNKRFRMSDDSVELLKDLHVKGILETTPNGDYDDSYMLSYAMKKSACILSNDKFRDQEITVVEKIVQEKIRTRASDSTKKMTMHLVHHRKGGMHGGLSVWSKCSRCNAEIKRELENYRSWLRKHLITYAYIGEDIILNPSFQLPLG